MNPVTSSVSALLNFNGAKVGVLEDGGKELNRVGELLKSENREDPNHAKLAGVVG
ncbi:MAG: hypothetical protein R3B91_14390 [Planctomycetaceae bacterium]